MPTPSQTFISRLLLTVLPTLLAGIFVLVFMVYQNSARQQSMSADLADITLILRDRDERLRAVEVAVAAHEASHK